MIGKIFSGLASWLVPELVSGAIKDAFGYRSEKLRLERDAEIARLQAEVKLNSDETRIKEMIADADTQSMRNLNNTLTDNVLDWSLFIIVGLAIYDTPQAQEIYRALSEIPFFVKLVILLRVISLYGVRSVFKAVWDRASSRFKN